MSFLKRLGKAVVTGGASELGSAGKIINPVGGMSSGLFDGIFGSSSKDPNAGIDQYNNSLMGNARSSAEDKKRMYYGNTLNSLGKETESYVSRLQGNLDKNVAKADLYNQAQAQSRGVAEARAGLSGIDNTALNEGSRRRASFDAAAINEDAKRNALDLYGRSIGNRIEGANTIDANEMMMAIAQMKQPQMQQNPGLLGSIFGGFGL